MALVLQKFVGCKLKLVVLGPIVYGPPHPQQDPAQLRAEIASSIFTLGVCSSGGLTAATCFLNLLSPVLFHKLLTSVFTLQTLCQSVSPCSILAHSGPTPQAAGPSFCCRCFPEPAPVWLLTVCVLLANSDNATVTLLFSLQF